jgi:hypothetical protein
MAFAKKMTKQRKKLTYDVKSMEFVLVPEG